MTCGYGTLTCGSYISVCSWLGAFECHFREIFNMEFGLTWQIIALFAFILVLYMVWRNRYALGISSLR